jgi:2-hydroxycyclohexanecarboxyl-CoA dehydrogenase
MEVAMRLDGKTAVVTGGASGIGRAAAEALALAGAHVIVGDVNREMGESVADTLRVRALGADFLYLDVTDADSVEEFRRGALELRPQVDIVANVAGWGRTEPFVQNDPKLWRRLIDLNFLGPVQVTRAFIEPMIARQSGKIVSVASDAGRVGSLGETVYSGAKGGVIAFTKALARELARFNITVNCVCPGPTDTPLMAAVPDKIKDAFERATPMRRLAKPQEVADAILFFASPRSDFVTGQVLSVSGGLTMAG